jgi:type II secretory pathway predicted ATPase ExeA
MHEDIKRFFGLKVMPFSKPIAASELFETADMKELHGQLELALHEDFALVSGSPGSGKSSAVRRFIDKLDSHMYPSVYITAENYKIGDVAKLLLSGLSGIAPFHGYVALKAVKQHITKIFTEKNQKPILIIDEAQDIPVQTLASIKNLVNFSMDSRSMLLVILCGQYELIGKIKMAQLESLRRRIRVQHSMLPMPLDECSKFIVYHMKRAGIERAFFSDELVAEIFQLSQGIMSNVNNICFDLIVHAAREKKEIIEIGILEKIILQA